MTTGSNLLGRLATVFWGFAALLFGLLVLVALCAIFTVPNLMLDQPNLARDNVIFWMWLGTTFALSGIASAGICAMRIWRMRSRPLTESTGERG